MKNHAIIKKAAVAVAIFAVAFLISFSQAFYDLDRMLSDPLMQSGASPSGSIKIIAIDEKTLQKYGNVSDWTRDHYAGLVSLLNADPAKAPSVVVFDMMFVSEKDAVTDAAFAQACEQAGNVITAINGRTVVSFESMREYLYDYFVGDTITVTYEREGQQTQVNVKLVDLQ